MLKIEKNTVNNAPASKRPGQKLVSVKRGKKEKRYLLVYVSHITGVVHFNLKCLSTFWKFEKILTNFGKSPIVNFIFPIFWILFENFENHLRIFNLRGKSEKNIIPKVWNKLNVLVTMPGWYEPRRWYVFERPRRNRGKARLYFAPCDCLSDGQ